MNGLRIVSGASPSYVDERGSIRSMHGGVNTESCIIATTARPASFVH